MTSTLPPLDQESRSVGEDRSGPAPSLNHVEVGMPTVVRMKVILSPPGLILKERPQTEGGFKPAQASVAANKGRDHHRAQGCGPLRPFLAAKTDRPPMSGPAPMLVQGRPGRQG